MLMRKIFTLALVFGLSACSINIGQPPVPTLSSEVIPSSPTSEAPDDAAPVVESTTIPITWSGLNLTGRLVCISVTSGVDLASKIQVLNLATGEITTRFTTTQQS